MKKHFLVYLNKLLIATMIIGATLGVNKASAQNISASAKLDSMLMFIGGQMNLTIEVNQPIGLNLKFQQFTDTISQFIEVVEAGKIDTLSKNNNRIQLQQVYRVTSFDSGVHLIRPIIFELADETAQQIASTEPIALKVVNPFDNVDPQKGIFDIKKPINTPFHLSELKPYISYIIGFIIFIGAIVFFLIWKFNRKLIMPLLGKEKVIEPPHVIALRELERIKAEKLWQKDQTKKYYSQLTGVLRQYIEDRFNIPALEQVSDETIAAIKNIDEIDEKNRENLTNILHLSDLVKFAKFQPLIDENDLSMINAIFFVNQTKYEEIKSLEEEKESIKNANNETSETELLTGKN
ncbi:MAG: hypothetical protein JW717_08480 [Marinilabiliaceae bacterium]|nr:hypothetical protein [Marinilabiliaceae bacterium]